MAHNSIGQGLPSRANAGHEHRQDELAQALSDAARRMHEASDPDEALRAVVTAAVDLIPARTPARSALSWDAGGSSRMTPVWSPVQGQSTKTRPPPHVED